MKTADTRRKVISTRTSRVHGDATKARIIEAAGELFSRQGYAETTNKEISEAAQTNFTSINYHFGSREGLYDAVIAEVGNFMLNAEFLRELAESDLPARKKLSNFIDSVTTLNKTAWQVRLWGREVVNPSPQWIRKAQKNVTPKFNVVLTILSDMTRIPMGDPVLFFCLTNVVSPVLLRAVAGVNAVARNNVPVFTCGEEVVRTYFKDFVFAGLDRLAALYAEKNGSRVKRPAHDAPDCD